MIPRRAPLYLSLANGLAPLKEPHAIAALEAWQRINGPVLLHASAADGLPVEAIPSANAFFKRLEDSSKGELPVLVSDDEAMLARAQSMKSMICLLLGEIPDPAAAVSQANLPDIAALERLFHSAAGAGELLSLFSASETTWSKPMEQKALVIRESIRLKGLALFGTGTLGRQALASCRRAGLEVSCFLDNNPARQGETIDGIPCISPSALPPGRVVAVASGNFATEIIRQLAAAGVKNIVSLGELFYVTREPSQPEKDYGAALYTDRYKLLSLVFLLDDARSQEVLGHLIAYRKSLSPPDAARAKTNAPQWFDPDYFRPSPSCRFADGGAFDGDTIAAFIKASPAYASITGFEPDENLAARGREKYARDPKIIVHHAALSDQNGIKHFDASGMTAGRLSTEGIAVPTMTLDSACAAGVDFIKLDIEGEEMNALLGAKTIIGKFHPAFAIAAYHKVEDLWALPSALMKLGSYRKFGLRHYTESTYETVLYTC